MRRIPFWLRATRAKLGPPARVLTKQGRYEGNTRTGRARVSSYRYPGRSSGFGVSNSLPGPEQVFRVRVQGRSPTSASRITRQPRGVSVTPRLVYAGDENRLAGIPALPSTSIPIAATRTETSARRRGEQAVGRRVRRRLRDEIARGGGAVLLPGLDRRQDATAREAAHADRDIGADAVRGRQRVGRRSSVDHRPRRRPARGIRAEVGPSQRAARRRRAGDAPRSSSASPTSRRRRTPRASSASSRTRRSSEGRSDSANGVGSCSSMVGRLSRSRWTLSSKSSRSVRTTLSCDFRRARPRRARPSAPMAAEIRGHSAMTRVATAQASSAANTRLTTAS